MRITLHTSDDAMDTVTSTRTMEDLIQQRRFVTSAREKKQLRSRINTMKFKQEQTEKLMTRRAKVAFEIERPSLNRMISAWVEQGNTITIDPPDQRRGKIYVGNHTKGASAYEDVDDLTWFGMTV